MALLSPRRQMSLLTKPVFLTGPEHSSTPGLWASMSPSHLTHTPHVRSVLQTQHKHTSHTLYTHTHTYHNFPCTYMRKYPIDRGIC